MRPFQFMPSGSLNVTVLMYGLAAASVCGAPVSFAKPAPAKEPSTLFYVPFEDDVHAETPGGSVEPLNSRDIVFGPGTVGRAVLMRNRALLEYAAPGHLDRKRGTVSFWFKSNGDAAPGQTRWRTLFSHPRSEQTRVGSGALWFWFWGDRLRGDVSDPEDTYIESRVPVREGVWHHLAFTWGEEMTPGHKLYFDGREVGGLRDDYTPLRVSEIRAFQESHSFFVGNHQGADWEQADGWFDEFRIVNRPLTGEEIGKEINRVTPLRLKVPKRYFHSGEKNRIRVHLENTGSNIVQKPLILWIRGPGGAEKQKKADVRIPPGGIETLDVEIPADGEGRVTIWMEDETGSQVGVLREELWVGSANPYAAPPGELQTTDVELIEMADRFISGEGFAGVGDTRIRELDGTRYLEAGEDANERFAVRLHLPDLNVPYLIEFTYPDDRKRTMEMIAQSSIAGDSDYMLQTGVLTGDGYELSGEMRSFRCILWPRSRDTALIFMTAREGAPAAVSRIKVSRIEGGLPAADIHAADPVNGWNRQIALYYEDPALPYSFGSSTGAVPDFHTTVRQLTAYMKWSGQNMLIYPLVWYQGRIDEGYNPRGHPRDFSDMLLGELEARDLSFMATINLHNLPLSTDVPVSAETVADGSLHATPVMIWNTGRPNPGGWHDTSPNFNPLHPQTRAFLFRQLDEILERAADRPAFKGVVLHLTRHSPLWFGNLEAGYNDYNIEAFSRDTGIEVPVSRDAPDRGMLYYEWLMEHARDAWIRWRCEQLADLYRELAARLSAHRDDLRLGLFSYAPTVSELEDPRYGRESFALEINRESGLDPALFAEDKHIIISSSLYPADYRWSEGRHYQQAFPEAHAAQRDRHRVAGTYGLLESAVFPWVNMHDRYFEDAIGTLRTGETHWSGGGKAKPLDADWLDEVDWRVSTLNPPGQQFLQHYLFPLFHHDVLGFSKGGFLVGTHGVGEELAAFAKAYRSLPAVTFEDVPGGTETLRVRSLFYDGDTWLYLVNVSTGPAAVRIELNGKDRPEVYDLSTGEHISVTEKTLEILLQPFQLRAFRAAGKREACIAHP